MGRPLKIPWQQDHRELFYLYTTELREGDPHVATRLQALFLLRHGKSLEEVSEILEVHYRTVQKWLAWYRRGGLEKVRRHPVAGPGRCGRLTEEQVAALRDELARGTLRSAQEVADWVYEVFGEEYTLSGIRSLLRRIQGAPAG